MITHHLRASINDWDIEEAEGESLEQALRVYAANCRVDAARHRADAEAVEREAERAEKAADAIAADEARHG